MKLEQRGNISFIDTDCVLNGKECIGRDGFYISREGSIKDEDKN